MPPKNTCWLLSNRSIQVARTSKCFCSKMCVKMIKETTINKTNFIYFFKEFLMYPRYFARIVLPYSASTSNTCDVHTVHNVSISFEIAAAFHPTKKKKLVMLKIFPVSFSVVACKLFVYMSITT